MGRWMARSAFPPKKCHSLQGELKANPGFKTKNAARLMEEAWMVLWQIALWMNR